ncbi:hypothetical protein SODALDRAFT_364048 [Sodiomyces alkalinus F11]|uniref:Secreted protein n=1 Tax=Sodiomyces alkalinus (strain CBS 110278 / VKM F-3762 / F11) TaxID=1314773 RepID=A0A3N2PJW9_SODAK|nr:hypothetical protein SODALDRAFT_364048 [Sodiomyces alkalinus F11]ROT34813.1 hypothetical protein SODALDRAFT_364048 [Sodiomyces alkalinus F11]
MAAFFTSLVLRSISANIIFFASVGTCTNSAGLDGETTGDSSDHIISYAWPLVDDGRPFSTSIGLYGATPRRLDRLGPVDVNPLFTFSRQVLGSSRTLFLTTFILPSRPPVTSCSSITCTISSRFGAALQLQTISKAHSVQPNFAAMTPAAALSQHGSPVNGAFMALSSHVMTSCGWGNLSLIATPSCLNSRLSSPSNMST